MKSFSRAIPFSMDIIKRQKKMKSLLLMVGSEQEI